MKKKDTDELLTGSYDGIQEYDNDLPKWWVWLFYGTIVFGIFYAIDVHFLGKATEHERLAAQMSELEDLQKQHEAKNAAEGPREEDLLAKVADSTAVQKGAAVFAAKCAMCHGSKAEGLVGPNLTDRYWLHGNTLSDIKTVIEKGVLEKGMLAWKGVLPDDDILSLVAFIGSIKNTEVKGKPPQGNEM